MLLIKLSDQTYPYVLAELQRDYPNVSFPKDLEGFDPTLFGAAEVVTDLPPAYNAATETITPNQPQLINDEWRVTWTVRPLTLEEIKARLPIDWDGFNAAMLADTAFNTIVGTVFTQAPSVAISLPTALAQVSTNGSAAFALVFTAFCQIGQVDSQQRQSWADLAESFNLPSSFVALIRGQ